MNEISIQSKQSCIAGLVQIVGADHVSTNVNELRIKARDRLPFGIFKDRSGSLPGSLPSLIVWPANSDEVSAVLKLTRELGVSVIARGEGSGVLGGAVPLAGEVVIDLTRINRLLKINETDSTVTVEAGMNGWEFEQALNAAGWTCGHFPQSIQISTVGGWAACRGAGQASTRYGKIEDMVVGLKALLPDGSALEVRPLPRRSVGPSIRDIIVGNEGTLAVITELTLRIWKRPEVERGVVLAFPTLEAAMTAFRQSLQAELRPAVARIYDEVESKQRSAGITAFNERPFLALVEFHGSRRMVDLEEVMMMEIVRANGGEVVSDEPYQQWRKDRYLSLSMKWQEAGHFMDTIEVVGNWSVLPTMYERMKAVAQAVHPDVYFAAHWSHVYVEGACQYMSIRLPPMPDELALPLHARLWNDIQSLTLDLDGSIAHHHGAGMFRNQWMARELGNGGMALLQRLKDALDEGNLLNPGKLGLRLSGASAPSEGEA